MTDISVRAFICLLLTTTCVALTFERMVRDRCRVVFAILDRARDTSFAKNAVGACNDVQIGDDPEPILSA
jgi:hypothetical protein